MKSKTNNKSFVIFLIAMLCTLFSTSYAEDTTIASFEKKLKETKTFSCHFTQEYYDSFQDKQTFSEGRL
ncbi:hypothetical protein KKA14_02055, partial [bacterium]|nr:hypothetical protein [bacterium]